MSSFIDRTLFDLYLHSLFLYIVVVSVEDCMMYVCFISSAVMFEFVKILSTD